MKYPVELLAVSDIAGPVFVDRCDETLLLTLQQVPDGVAGGGRTGIVVVSPRHIGLGFDVRRKAADVEVR